MPYIVKSSLDVGGKIVPWNEQESRKLIKEKEKFLKEKEKEEEKVTEIEEKDVISIELVDEVPEGEELLDGVNIVETIEEKPKKNYNKKK